MKMYTTDMVSYKKQHQIVIPNLGTNKPCFLNESLTLFFQFFALILYNDTQELILKPLQRDTII